MPHEVKTEMEKLGFTWNDPDGAPDDEHIEKFIALQALMGGWVEWMVESGDLLWVNRKTGFERDRESDTFRDWLNESSEEWLVG